MVGPQPGGLVQVHATQPQVSLTDTTGAPVENYGGNSLPTQHLGWKDAGSACQTGCVKCGKHACQCLWFGGVSGLLMTRDDGDHYAFSYDTANEADQRTNTRDAAMDWSYGFEVRGGRYFNCGCNAVELVYWGLYPDSDSTQTTSLDVLGNLNGILNWDSLDYNGVGADTIVNTGPGASAVHALYRDYEFHNVELNLWHFGGPCGVSKCGCARYRSNWLCGIRYLRFNESLLFAADANDFAITFEDDELFYDIDIDNDLIGFQVGNEAQYNLSDRCAFNFGIKLGIFNNHIDHVSQIGGNLGLATINNGPFNGAAYYVDSSKDDVAFLGEVNLGAEYCFHRNWTAIAGYRAMAITGVALPAEQIYPDLRGINDVAIIDSNSSVILHGAYAGLEYNW